MSDRLIAGVSRHLVAGVFVLALAVAGGFAYALTETSVPVDVATQKPSCKELVHLPNHWVISFAHQTLAKTFTREGQAPFASAAAVAQLYSPDAWQAVQAMQNQAAAGAKEVTLVLKDGTVVWDYAENATQARWDLRVPAVLQVSSAEGGGVQKIDKPLVLKIVQPDRCRSATIIHTFWDNQAEDFSIQIPSPVSAQE